MAHASGGSARGYVMVTAAYAVMACIGAVVTWAPGPAVSLLFLRMAVAAAVLAPAFARRTTLREIGGTGVWKRVVLMAVLDSSALLLFFVSTRLTSVAVAMFLIFLAPLWVAVLAPRLMRQKTDRAVWPAMALAMGGLALIVVPPALGHELDVSVAGLVAGFASSLFLAGFMMTVSALREHGLRSVTIVLSECALDAVLLLPLFAWLTWGSGEGPTGRDLVAGLFLGTVCTAFTYVLWTEGVGLVPVQHVPILGYVEPMLAPVYAYVLLGEVPARWTVAGGALIVAAGALVVVKGGRSGAVSTQV